MRDKTIPLVAKALYSYLCSYAGSGSTAYPKRDKIVRDLKMNKNTLNKHINTLLDKGLISVKRTTTGNLYTIMQDVPCYDNIGIEDLPETGDPDYLLSENILL